MVSNDWRVLIVEDEQDSIRMVSKILSHHGIQVHVANNGYECLDALGSLDPTLIVMDLAMPEMDGWETLAALRSDTATSHIPVVAITAYHSANVADDARGVSHQHAASRQLPASPESDRDHTRGDQCFLRRPDGGVDSGTPFRDAQGSASPPGILLRQYTPALPYLDC